jgi:hypothetical protein
MPCPRIADSALAIICVGLIVGPVAGCSRTSPTSAPTSPAPISVAALPPRVAPEIDGPTPRFRDIAAEAGLTVPYFNAADGQFRLVETMGSGIGLIDYDGDDRLDIFVAQGCPLPHDPSQKRYGARLYRNVGDGKFADVTEKAGVGFNGYGSGVAVGDYNGDGRDDVYLSAFGEGVLYRNKGDGTFEDATKAAKVASSGWATSCAFADLDSDGDLDLYVAHYLANTVDAEGRPTVSCNAMPGSLGYCPPLAFAAEPDALYRNNGDGTFTEIGKDAGITTPAGNGLGLAIADWDDDGKLDIFVANDQTPNILFRNLGGLRFEEVAVSWGLAFNESGNLRAGMGIAVGDYDEDGRLDLLVTNFYGEASTLYRNVAPRMFMVETSQARLLAPTRSKLGFGTGFLDYDNDGRLDLFIANGHVNDVRPIGIPYAMTPQLFKGAGRGKFADVSSKAGPYFQSEWLGRSVAFGDIDNDGDPDIVVSHIGRPPALLLNDTGPGGRSLRLTLRGSGPGRDATGAKVTAEVGGRAIVRTVTAGTSYLGASDRRVLIGLGDGKVDRLTVRWPKGTTQTFASLPAGDALIIEEGREPKPAQEPGWVGAKSETKPNPR